MGLIYVHKNKINGRCYVGSTTQDVRRRWRRSDKTYNSYRNCPVFFRALKKHGWDNFETSILETNISFDDLSRVEEFYIRSLDTIAPNGYNTTSIVDGRTVFAESTKKKISDSKKAYYANLDEKPVAWNKREHIYVAGIESKLCSKCKEIFPVSNFCKYNRTWDKLHWYCRPCHRKQIHNYRPKKLSKEQWKQSYVGRKTKKKPRHEGLS